MRGGDESLGLGQRLARRADPVRRFFPHARRQKERERPRCSMPQGVTAENGQAGLEPKAITAGRETERVGQQAQPQNERENEKQRAFGAARPARSAFRKQAEDEAERASRERPWHEILQDKKHRRRLI